MTTTWIGETRLRSSFASRARHVQYWMSVSGLACADILSFLVAHLLFRAGRSAPVIMLFTGNGLGRQSVTLNVFAILALLFVVVRYISGDYSRRQLFWDGAKLTTVALIVASLPDLFMLLVGQGLYSPWAVVLSWLFLVVAVPLMRQGARHVMSQLGMWRLPTAIIGVGDRTAEANIALNNSLSLGFSVHWLVVENTETKVSAELSGLIPVHSSDPVNVARTMLNAGCKQAVMLAEDTQSAHFAEVARHLLEADIPVAIIPSLNRLPLAGVTTNYFFGQDILLLQVRSNVQRLPWRICKRSFDIVVSVLLLALLAPFFLIVAILIKMDTSGPVTYSQRRIGRHGVPFNCLKFRTMVPNADAVLQRWQIDNPELYKEFLTSFKLRDDPRITPIGKWLRRTSLDELPQLWNVLRGEMSLVGPRPIPEQQLRDQYGSAAQLYVRVRPGMSGLWQISGRSETTNDQRVILDEWYILNWSFWYDIVILVQTAWIVVTGKGAY